VNGQARADVVTHHNEAGVGSLAERDQQRLVPLVHRCALGVVGDEVGEQGEPGLCCTFLATGLSSLRTGALPRWICLVSVILGVGSPLGPAAFAPFALFPVWVIVVAAILARRMRAFNSQNPANN
jgi:hypothetical protein